MSQVSFHVPIRWQRAFRVLIWTTVILVSTNLLWKIQISLRKKLALAAICSLTAFIICVTIVRVVVSLAGPYLDHLKLIFWGNLELSVGRSTPVFDTSIITNG